MTETDRKKLIETKFTQRFGTSPSLWVRAPGRVDLMGSHTDYNLGYVMTMPISRDIRIAAAPSTEKEGRLYSMNLEDERVINLANIQKTKGTNWIDYPAGVAFELQQAGRPTPGFNGVVHSTVPIGSGLSSSAAFEAAVSVLFQQLGGFTLPPLENAQLCQRAENNFVGMNCGILDQYSSILGEAGKTVLLDCKKLTHQAVPFPASWSVVICDTNAPRELTGSEYGDRRRQCEHAVEAIETEYPEVASLRDASMHQLEKSKSRMSIESYKRGKFVITENQRCIDLAEALKTTDAEQAGKLFYESFLGARDLFEILVPAMEQMEEAMLASPGVIGARQAGAGFGGCMIALVEKKHTEKFCIDVTDRYRNLSGLEGEAYPVTPEAGAGVVEKAG